VIPKFDCPVEKTMMLEELVSLTLTPPTWHHLALAIPFSQHRLIAKSHSHGASGATFQKGSAPWPFAAIGASSETNRA
jgi:hypothetical protein